MYKEHTCSHYPAPVSIKSNFENRQCKFTCLKGFWYIRKFYAILSTYTKMREWIDVGME